MLRQHLAMQTSYGTQQPVTLLYLCIMPILSQISRVYSLGTINRSFPLPATDFIIFAKTHKFCLQDSKIY
jgi:hypothetical protein